MRKNEIEKYCNKVTGGFSVEHIENCSDILHALSKIDKETNTMPFEIYWQWLDSSGCPSNFLDNYDNCGLCHFEETDHMNTVDKEDLCCRCWAKALEIKIE